MAVLYYQEIEIAQVNLHPSRLKYFELYSKRAALVTRGSTFIRHGTSMAWGLLYTWRPLVASGELPTPKKRGSNEDAVIVKFFLDAPSQ